MPRLKFEERILIQCSPEEAFDYTQDYNCRLAWDTFLIKAELLDGATKPGIGVKAFCVARNRLGMVTEYVSFQRPGSTAIKMTKGPYMFKEFLGSWRFKRVDDNRTEVTFLYAFSLRFPFDLVSGLVKRVLTENVRQRLSDLKQNLEGKSKAANIGLPQ